MLIHSSKQQRRNYQGRSFSYQLTVISYQQLIINNYFNKYISRAEAQLRTKTFSTFRSVSNANLSIKTSTQKLSRSFF
ncbi:hypothetical protein [Dapis sp. BLCC M172]|uniref:hypothetical protein n=1 Tax=Dapis sp. BLCC M172 TaxID=2975281 RepID=UPI003CF1AEB4